jgi:hypothetical protein
MLELKTLAIIGVIALGATQAPDAYASAPQCYPYGSTGYCQYDGRVTKVYVNAYNQVILYFDAPVNSANAAAVGMTGVTVESAAIYNINSNLEFAKMLLASLLAAQARGATVTVQMMSVSGGYLEMDRIWVNE